MKAENKQVDPVTTEIIRNAFTSIAEDMNATLIRSAYTPVIYEGKDCAVALIDANGEVLGQSLGLPLFLGNLELCIKLIAEKNGWDYFKEGDVIYTNDAYITGTHLNDATIIIPIFRDGKRIGFAASRAHWLDVGAKDPGQPVDSHEIYQEGVRWGPTRLYKNGKARDDVIDLLRQNSRFGDELVGDLNAQIAAGRIGDMRLQTLYDRFGENTITAARERIFEQTRLQEQNSIAAIEDGSYYAEGTLDDDGLGSDPVPIKVRIDVKGENMEVNLDGSSPQVRGCINCGITQTIAAVRVGFKHIVNPESPVNGGSFQSLTVTAAPGSMFYAQEPAACAWYFSSLGLLIDLIGKALAPALPDKAAGAHYGDSMVVYIGGEDPRKNNTRFLMVEPTTGGWGGFNGGDGADSLINLVNGSFRDLPIEIFESKYPVLIRSYGIRTDSGGAGCYRGGNGTYREYELKSEASVTLWFERSHTAAWGLLGGKDGIGPEISINEPGEKTRHCLKANSLSLKPGTVIKTQTGGGGGWGEPEKRDRKLIESDIKNRYISREHARELYGYLE
ncbi:MAG: hydantoinase B/oxoprolinase family protein [Gammaproteobacteria bacterium]|nr:hydantoinase B/oxoprolinase family protein [Gammaproteobacteria bacterium]